MRCNFDFGSNNRGSPCKFQFAFSLASSRVPVFCQSPNALASSALDCGALASDPARCEGLVAKTPGRRGCVFKPAAFYRQLRGGSQALVVLIELKMRKCNHSFQNPGLFTRSSFFHFQTIQKQNCMKRSAHSKHQLGVFDHFFSDDRR